MCLVAQFALVHIDSPTVRQPDKYFPAGGGTYESKTESIADLKESPILSDGSLNFGRHEVSNVNDAGIAEKMAHPEIVAKAGNTQTTEMVIENLCMSSAYISVILCTADGWQFHRWFELQFQETLSFEGVVNTTAYIYGASSTYTWDGDSDYCLHDGSSCFKEVNLGTLQPEKVFHYLSCYTDQSNGASARDLKRSPMQNRPILETYRHPPDVQDLTLDGPRLEWLLSHNNRRNELYAENGMSQKDLIWSDSLAAGSKAWAEQLVGEGCAQLRHDPDRRCGENLAMSIGSGVYAVGRTPDEVMRTWFDREKTLGLGRNGHFTQVGWRATGYVGCGEAQTELAGGSTCFVHVCRYVRPGNCNVWLEDGVSWYEKMLSETSLCGPFCPDDGCI